MISLDWKERLKKDTIDYYERKLPAGDYDIDIIYNAYPQRIDNNIPHAVITLVGKTIAAKLSKDPENYMPFYNYLLNKKGENGRMIFAYIMARVVKKKPDVFIPYLKDFLTHTTDQKSCNLIIDKTIFPIFKKEPLEHLDMLSNWIKKDNAILMSSLQKMMVKLITFDPTLVKPIFNKMETSWLYATPNMAKFSSNFLKSTYKVDPQFFISVYDNYKHTRNPVFADILCNAICCYDDTIQEICDHWAISGNIKLKKIGIHGQKLLQKKKK